MVPHAILFTPNLIVTGPLRDNEVLAARLKDGSIYYLQCSPRSYTDQEQQKFWLDWEIANRCQRIAPDQDVILGQLQATPPDWEKFTQSGLLLPVGVPLRKGLPLTVKVCRRGSERLEISDAPLETVTVVHREQVLSRVEPSSVARR